MHVSVTNERFVEILKKHYDFNETEGRISWWRCNNASVYGRHGNASRYAKTTIQCTACTSKSVHTSTESSWGSNSWTPPTPNTAGQGAQTTTGPGSQPTQFNNPYAAAASGGANPWKYNAQTGGYEPNNTAYMPDWMRKPVAPVEPVPVAKKTERQVKDYTPYDDTMTGTTKQAEDLLRAEHAKRGKTIDTNAIFGKYGGRVKDNQVTGALYNEIMKDLFGEDIEVPDSSQPVPIKPGTGGPDPAPGGITPQVPGGPYGGINPGGMYNTGSPWMNTGGGINYAGGSASFDETTGQYKPRPYGMGGLMNSPGMLPEYQTGPYMPKYSEAAPQTPEQIAAAQAKYNSPEFKAQMEQMRGLLTNMRGIGG